jgi:Methyltransferase FkbM domain
MMVSVVIFFALFFCTDYRNSTALPGTRAEIHGERKSTKKSVRISPKLQVDGAELGPPGDGRSTKKTTKHITPKLRVDDAKEKRPVDRKSSKLTERITSKSRIDEVEETVSGGRKSTKQSGRITPKSRIDEVEEWIRNAARRSRAKELYDQKNSRNVSSPSKKVTTARKSGKKNIEDAGFPTNATAAAMIRFADPDSPYKLRNASGTMRNRNWAGENQDLCTLSLLQGYVKKGYFVEAGAYDGENLSNTLLLEYRHGWSGLLVEPNPILYERILSLNRKCSVINAGISTKNTSMVIRFKLAGPLGGIVSHLSRKHLRRIKSDINRNVSWTKQEAGTGEVTQVVCFPLEELLLAAGNRELVVDYFSLDTEGSELSILNAIDFNRVTFGVIGVEHNNYRERRDALSHMMRKRGYIQHKNVSWEINHADAIFYNPAYFAARNIPDPENIYCK